MTNERLRREVLEIAAEVIGSTKAKKMMESTDDRPGGILVYLSHGCCLGDAITIQEKIEEAGFFIPDRMGNAVVYVTADDPDAAQEEDLEAQSARVYEAVKPFAEAISQANVEAAQEKPEETAQERAARENRETCRRIAEEVEAYASGDAYRCPHCGEIHHLEEYEELVSTPGVHFCPDCLDDVTLDDLEAVSLYDYFEDCLDIEYRCGSDREYRSARVMVTCGGPNIYVDTQRRAVCLYWWTETAEYPLLSDAVDAVDAWAAEYWEVI